MTRGEPMTIKEMQCTFNLSKSTAHRLRNDKEPTEDQRIGRPPLAISDEERSAFSEILAESAVNRTASDSSDSDDSSETGSDDSYVTEASDDSEPEEVNRVLDLGDPVDEPKECKIGHTLSTIQFEMEQKGFPLSRASIHRHLKAIGVQLVSRPKHPWIVNEMKWRKKRVDFCYRMLDAMNKKKVHPESIVFSDECIVRAEDGKPMQWVLPGYQRTKRRCTSYTASVHVWGAIGIANFRVLKDVNEMVCRYRTDGKTLNSSVYIKMLEEHYAPALRNHRYKKEAWLVQDGCKVHTSKMTKACFFFLPVTPQNHVGVTNGFATRVWVPKMSFFNSPSAQLFIDHIGFLITAVTVGGNLVPKFMRQSLGAGWGGSDNRNNLEKRTGQQQHQNPSASGARTTQLEYSDVAAAQVSCVPRTLSSPRWRDTLRGATSTDDVNDVTLSHPQGNSSAAPQQSSSNGATDGAAVPAGRLHLAGSMPDYSSMSVRAHWDSWAGDGVEVVVKLQEGWTHEAADSWIRRKVDLMRKVMHSHHHDSGLLAHDDEQEQQPREPSVAHLIKNNWKQTIHVDGQLAKGPSGTGKVTLAVKLLELPQSGGGMTASDGSEGRKGHTTGQQPSRGGSVGAAHHPRCSRITFHVHYFPRL